MFPAFRLRFLQISTATVLSTVTCRRLEAAKFGSGPGCIAGSGRCLSQSDRAPFCKFASTIRRKPVSESAGTVYHANADDISEEALELLHDLVQPWSARSVFGKLIDLVRREHHQEATFS